MSISYLNNSIESIKALSNLLSTLAANKELLKGANAEITAVFPIIIFLVFAWFSAFVFRMRSNIIVYGYVVCCAFLPPTSALHKGEL
jgi:hypothetical protein